MQRVPEPEEYMDIPERAQAYADADFDEVNQNYIDRILSLFGNINTARVLDIGTGPGEIPSRLARARPNWNIIGVDASLPMLRLANAPTSALQWTAADSKALPFPDQSFDLILSNSILHHIIDPVSFWRETKRLLRPGGGMLHRDLTRPDTQSDATRIVETYSGDEHPLLKEDFYNSLLAAYTPDEVETQLHAAELSNMHVETVSDRHMDIWQTRA